MDGGAGRSPEGPTLTPQFCFNQTALRDFLRLSRASLDDSITQSLNALNTPAARGFDPRSTSTRNPHTGPRSQIPGPACDNFKQRVLFPTWQMRSDLLSYCASVATSPDPSDPDQLLRNIEDAAARERVVDERLDPYSGRYFPRDTRAESLALLVRNERGVENIVRQRTWRLVEEKCGYMGSMEDALGEWRKRNHGPGGG